MTPASWAAAPIANGFVQNDPREGTPATFDTEVRLLYDDRYLYILGRMYDPAPDSIISLLSRRDVRTDLPRSPASPSNSCPTDA